MIAVASAAVAGYAVGALRTGHTVERMSESIAVTEPVANPSDSAAILVELRALRADLESFATPRTERVSITPANDDIQKVVRRLDEIEAALRDQSPERVKLLDELRKPEIGLFDRLVREYEARPVAGMTDKGLDTWLSDWCHRTSESLVATYRLWRLDDVIQAFGRPTRIDEGPELHYVLARSPSEVLVFMFDFNGGFVSNLGPYLDNP